jgi:hypothetical protein
MFEYFPTAWKSAKFLPIQKPGKPPSDPCSHRPIRLLSTLCKLLERAVACRLNSLIHQNHILPPEKFGVHKNIQKSLNLQEPPNSLLMALIFKKNIQAWSYLILKRPMTLFGLTAYLTSLSYIIYRTIFSSLSPTWKTLPSLSIIHPKTHSIRSTPGCSAIKYIVFSLPFWHAASSTHSRHIIRKWHSS